MTFLELCQRLRTEAGISGTGATSSKINDWIKSAYQDIQSMYATLKFLQASFAFDTTADKQDYTPTEAGITDLATWRMNRPNSMTVYPKADSTNERYLTYIPWDSFRENYLIGATRTSKGPPDIVTIRPDNTLTFWPIPDNAFTVNGEYFKVPDVMSLDTDVPIFPARFHMAIVWRALMFYGANEGAIDLYTHGQNEFNQVLRELQKNQLPHIFRGNPLV